MKYPVAIVTDSAASLPETSDALHPMIHVAPMQITIGDRTYLDGVDLKSSDFYRLMRRHTQVATTSAPTPGTFLEKFREAAAKGNSVLCLTVSRKFSASYDSARLAIEQANREMPETKIVLIDTKCAAGSQGLIIVESWKAALKGYSLEEVVKIVLPIVSRVRLLAFVDTMYYLWKGGRVSIAVHATSFILRIKPILELANGEIRRISASGGRRKAMSQLLELMEERLEEGSLRVAIVHADCIGDALELEGLINEHFSCADLYISEFTPAMGVHIGPGMLGLAFWTDTCSDPGVIPGS